MSNYIFTSESVSAGHPDKICDQISDAILDEALRQDPNSRTAVETLVKDNKVILAGEVKTNATIDYDNIVRNVICSIGYDNDEIGFNGNNCSITNLIGEQSSDIALGVDRKGAGDQGLMFGYACNENEVLMPTPIYYANLLMKKQQELMQKLVWLRPDAKVQLSCIYDNNKVVGIDTIVFSTQHTKDISQDDLTEAVREEIINKVIPHKWLTNNTKYHINPTGKFIIGGPVGDAGLTGRKIIVDTYGGMARHGGGAFSGKDPSKVDRSAAYATRHVAKNIVALKMADKCEIQISYAIGVDKPTSINVETFGSSSVPIKKIYDFIDNNFDLTPQGIIDNLKLKRPTYQKVAAHGHFGRTDEGITWEDLLKNI